MEKRVIDQIVSDLNKKVEEAGATIKWYQEPIDEKHLDVTWYGGRICEIRYKGWTFILGAYGIVDATLIDKKTGDELVSIKDKYGNGRFYDDMSCYIKDDLELTILENDMSEDKKLEVANNNWLEVLVTNPDGVDVDPGWVTADYQVILGVEEILAGMDEVIAQG